MKKAVALLFALVMIFSGVFCVSAEDGTNFSVCYGQGSKKLAMEITTDKVSQVGGLDIQVDYNTEKWKLVSGTGKSELKDSVIEKSDGSVRLVWYTLEADTELSKELLSLSFKKISKDADIEDITVTVNDYYDNTLLMNDLPYEVVYKQDGSIKPSGGALIWVAVGILAVLALAAAYYFVIVKSKHSGKH